MRGNDARHCVSSHRVCQSIQFQQDDTAQLKTLTNNQLTEVAIPCDQNAAVGLRHI